MAEHGEHEMGTMDITDHKRTWEGFMRVSTICTVLTAGLVLILMMIFG